MKTVYLIANGDLRLAANQACEKAQVQMEAQIIDAVSGLGYEIVRAHKVDKEKQHGFIDSQKYGIEVFKKIPEDAPVIVAEAVWQYSHHILPGLWTHRGPILTLANWSGTWPGLVGMLNLNGSLTKAGIHYSTLWGEDFKDKKFLEKLEKWLKKGKVKHDLSHVKSLGKCKVPESSEKLGRRYARRLREKKAIMGVFDEGCMGMFNAIVPDALLHDLGIFKERLSQSTLYAAMQQVTDKEAKEVYEWLRAHGVVFRLGKREEKDLTVKQILEQCKMYIAVMRIADVFGCTTVGIQYQQGLKDLVPASDLVEGLLNNVERPPVFHAETGEELYPDEALPHFNEVDECAGIDGLITYHLWKEMGLSPENTLHDLRWGRHFKGKGIDDFVWVFQISGAAPPAHFIGGYGGAVSERQPAMYFKMGGGTLKGVSKPGWIVWSRVFIQNGKLHYDTGLGEVVELPPKETEDRWKLTTSQWPIMHAVLKGITRDQMMARHKANHIQVAYATSRATARKALYAKAVAMAELGMEVSVCGKV